MTVTIYVKHRTEGKAAAAPLPYRGIPDAKWRREKLWKRKKKRVKMRIGGDSKILMQTDIFHELYPP